MKLSFLELALLAYRRLSLLDALPSSQRKRGRLLRILGRPRTAGLSQRMPGLDPLHDDRTPPLEEGIPPDDVRHGVPAGHLAIQPQTVVPRRQARRHARLEVRDRVICPVEEVRTGQVADVRQRMPDGRHLPVQNANDARLRLVEHHVVDLVVAVNQCASVLRLCCLVGEEPHHLHEMWQLTHGLLAFDVHCL